MVCLRVQLKGRSQELASRQSALISEIWKRFQQQGLLGVHEGTVLSESAFERGFETEPWIVDQGLAPEHRDWVAEAANGEFELYFQENTQAAACATWLNLQEVVSRVSDPIVEPDRDWNAEWRKSFNGIEIPPYFHVIPPWIESSVKGLISLRINPGAGFGTGTHETTRLCLEAIGAFAVRVGGGRLSGRKALDFGSGSGILSVALARLGAQVTGVEIDPLANDNARENARLNRLGDDVEFFDAIPRGFRYDILVANILRPILMEQADVLAAALVDPRTSGVILSGLIEKDLEYVLPRYEPLLAGRKPTIRSLGEWRALTWEPDR